MYYISITLCFIVSFLKYLQHFSVGVVFGLPAMITSVTPHIISEYKNWIDENEEKKKYLCMISLRHYRKPINFWIILDKNAISIFFSSCPNIITRRTSPFQYCVNMYFLTKCSELCLRHELICYIGLGECYASYEDCSITSMWIETCFKWSFVSPPIYLPRCSVSINSNSWRCKEMMKIMFNRSKMRLSFCWRKCIYVESLTRFHTV